MLFLGIDPGTNNTGYGLIRMDGNRVVYSDSGTIRTKSVWSLCEKLTFIYDELRKVIEKHQPEIVSIEQAFYAKNVHTTLVLGHVRGVILLAAGQASSLIMEFSPREIKKSVVGKGNASKDQVGFMVQRLLRLDTMDSFSPDACDALAAALCASFYAPSLLSRK